MMDIFEILLDNGKSIIKAMHDRNKKDMMDDAEYIPIIKTIICGIQCYAGNLNLSNDRAVELGELLKDYSRQLYVQVWLENGEEDEDVENETNQGREYFDYIYEHEEHPY